jgi:hypothetical protein
MLTFGEMLLLDNALPHIAALTLALLQHFDLGLFDHLPYSPDLAPSDYHLLTYSKNWLGSQRFKNKEDLMEDVKTLLGSKAEASLTQAYTNLFPDIKVASIPAVTPLISS